MYMDFSKLSKYSFFAFLFLLPFQTVLLLREPLIGGEKWQYGTIGVYFTDVLLVLSLSFVIYDWVRRHRVFSIKYYVSSIMYRGNPKYIIHNTRYKILAVFLCWSIFSIFWASDTALATYTAVKLLLAVGAFFFARSLDDAERGKAVKVLLVAAVLQSMLAIGQFLYQASPVSTLLGMSAHEAWQAGSSVLKLEGERWLRAYGSFPHPNMLGGFLATVLVAGIAYYVSSITHGENTKYIIRNTRYNLAYHLSTILILLALLLTFSRAAWLGAALGVGMIVFFQKSRIINHKSKIIFGVLGIGMLVFVFVLRDQIFPRFDPDVIAREGSVSERVVSLADAKTLITAHPLIGVGAGNFTAAVMKGEKVGGKGETGSETLRPVWSIQPAHNVFVLVFAELGAVGFLLFVRFFLSVIASAAKQSDNKNADLRFTIDEKASRTSLLQSKIFNQKSAILFALLPSLFLDHFLWSSHFGLLFFFLLAGLSARGCRVWTE